MLCAEREARQKEYDEQYRIQWLPFDTPDVRWDLGRGVVEIQCDICWATDVGDCICERPMWRLIREAAPKTANLGEIVQSIIPKLDHLGTLEDSMMDWMNTME